MSAESKNQGPTVWITACGHGDEVGGMVVIQEIFKKEYLNLTLSFIYNDLYYEFKYFTSLRISLTENNFTALRRLLKNC